MLEEEASADDQGDDTKLQILSDLINEPFPPAANTLVLFDVPKGTSKCIESRKMANKEC